MIKQTSILVWVSLVACVTEIHGESPPPPSLFSQFFQNVWATTTSLFDCIDDPLTASNFTIALDLVGVDDDSLFQTAVAKWSEVIVGDIPNHSGTLGGESSCGPWPDEIDDVYICGQYKEIDGPSGVLGHASLRHYRPTEGLPITGSMSFDVADVQLDKISFGVILHEMAHVLGLGALWVVNGITNSHSVPCTYAYDSAASREYRAISGCDTSIPIESDFPNPGSNCGHWKESCFVHEVMSTAANAELPVSRFTLAGLEDMGYDVDYDTADDFDANHMDSSCLCNNNNKRFLRNLVGEEDNSSVRKVSGPGRHLSSESHQKAIDYGQEIMEQNREQAALIPESEDAMDLGGAIIYVLYLDEDDTVYSIMVTAA